MKNIFALILIFSHLFSTVGFSMEVHECGSHKSYCLYGISIGRLCKCDHKDIKHSDDCCKDKKTVIKAEHSDKQTNKVFIAKQLIQDFEIDIPIEFNNRNVVLNGRNSPSFGTKHPPNHSPPLYILYNVFLI